MAQATFYAISGVLGFVVAVGENGRILHFVGDNYAPMEPGSPSTVNLRAVWVQSPTCAWAAGGGEVLRWDGRRWHHVTLAAPADDFGAIWGHPQDGVWVGGANAMITYRTDGTGGTIFHTDLEIRAIWGSGPTDVWYLCSERTVMHWSGEWCASEALPGDDDEEWNAIAGSGSRDPVYLVGPSGFMLEWDRRKWWELDTGTPDILTAACCAGPDLYVTTDKGQVRHWDGRTWRTVAFSAFGPLHAICYVDGVIWACGARGVTLQHMPADGAGKE